MEDAAEKAEQVEKTNEELDEVVEDIRETQKESAESDNAEDAYVGMRKRFFGNVGPAANIVGRPVLDLVPNPIGDGIDIVDAITPESDDDEGDDGQNSPEGCPTKSTN